MKTPSITAFLLFFFVLPMTAIGSPDDAKQPVSQTLYEIITRDGIEAGVKHYTKLKEEKADQYDFSETELNTLGYRFIREKNLEAATAVFKLNVEAYPESPNAHDSLGEAYLRAGEHEKAIAWYQKALAKLDNSNISDQTRDALRKNAKGKLAYLRNPDSLRQSTTPRDFLVNNPDLPYGKLNQNAPPETEHWGQLAGEWDCTIDVKLPNGNWVQGGNAKWIWKYILDGFAVQDLWYVKWIDLPPSLSNLQRDVAGTNIRMYLPAKKKWECVWFTNSTNSTSRFEATSTPEELVMTGSTPQGLSRITFFDITADSFEWKSERSQDDGETWTLTTKIHGKRVR